MKLKALYCYDYGGTLINYLGITISLKMKDAIAPY